MPRTKLTPENPDPVAPAEPATTAAPSKNRKPAVDLHVERAKQNCEKNAQETLGVATGFDEILEELVNNRVDTEELRVRLKNRIAEPLRGIGEQMFPECDRRLQALMTTPADATARKASDRAGRRDPGGDGTSPRSNAGVGEL